ncbi:MAG TPA: hypothetical protein VGN97_11210 [Mesorhizobium sp.]|jgi:hypothetical protein|nr:hypothetical protein [Mesorhizobium sp.]
MPDSQGKNFVHPEKWTPPPADWAEAAIQGDGFSARRVLGLGQTLVSGDLNAASAALGASAPAIGLWQVAEALPAFVRIARDRALFVSERPLALEDGWRAKGFALSSADDAWAVLDVKGEGLADLMADGATANLSQGSPSASTLFAGVPCLLYRAAPDKARLHVEAPLLSYVWRWLETREG